MCYCGPREDWVFDSFGPSTLSPCGKLREASWFGTEKGTKKVDDVTASCAGLVTLEIPSLIERWIEEVGVIWSSEDEFAGDALELSGEEGRGKLRKATGRSKHPEIRGWPNGVTRTS